jgi:30S ribosomal protein S31
MGKGDKKSKRGKIVNGSYGVRRRRKKVVKVEEKAVVKKKEKAKK